MSSEADNIIKMDSVMRYLNESYPALYTRVLDLGYPMITKDVENSTIKLDEQGTPRVAVNPALCESLSTEELASVVMHNTLHAVLNHHHSVDNFADEKKAGKAIDLIVNDYLSNNDFAMPSGENAEPSGEDTVGYDCSMQTIRSVYNDIEDDEDEQDPDGYKVGDDTDPEGEGNQEAQGFSSNDWMNDVETKEAVDQKLEDAKNEAEANGDEQELPDDIDHNDDEDESGVMQGLGESFEDHLQDAHIELKWSELLKRIDPDIIPEPSYMKKSVSNWAKPSRKLVDMYPEVLLPTYTKSHNEEGWGNEKPRVLMCLDTSGSVTREDKAAFIAMARSIPKDRCDLVLYGFHTKGYKIDIDNPVVHSGGTCFANALMKVINDECGGNPNNFFKACIIVTDLGDSYNNSHTAYYSGGGENKVKGFSNMRELMVEYPNLLDSFYVLHNHKGNHIKSEDFIDDSRMLNPYNYNMLRSDLATRDRVNGVFYPFYASQMDSMYSMINESNLKEMSRSVNF